MSDHARRIVRNTTYLTSAFVGQKVLAFLYFTLIARLAGVEGTGKYFLAVSITTIFSIIVDLGVQPVLVREIAKAKEKAASYLANALGIKLILSIIAYAAVVITVNLLNYPADTKFLVYLSGIVMLVDSWYLSFYSVFRGLQNLKYEAVGVVIGQSLVLVAGAASLYFGLPIYFLILSLLLGSAWHFFFSLSMLISKAKVVPTISFNKEVIRAIAKIAVPFALAGIFVKVSSYIDTVFLSKLAGDEAVGLYSVPYKITFALQFIPMAFAASLYPAMSEFYKTSQENLRRSYEQSMFYLLLIAAPISFGIASLAQPIIGTIFGTDYLPGVLTLQILIFSLIFIFLNFPVGSLLNATDRQKINTAIMGVAMGVNVVVNAVLIPRFVTVGAAIASISSNATLLLMGMIIVNKAIKPKNGHLFYSSIKILLSSVVMGAVVIKLLPFIHYLLLIPIGAAVYLLMIFITKAVTKADVQFIKEKIFKRA